MACFQACGSADEEYQHQNNNDVSEMCHNADTVESRHHHEHGAVTGGCIKNSANGDVKFLSKHDWSGRNKVPYPNSIAKHHAGTFVHNVDCNGQAGHKDEAAVVYSDDYDSAWLLAWSVQDHCGGCGNPNKVYVEAGSVDNYIEIDWCDIKAKLDASCETSYYVDETTGCEVFGKITSSNKAALAVTLNNY